VKMPSPVAVIVTCFNLGRTLEEALASILDQTAPPADITIVDDGSTDVYTRQVLSRLERAGHRVVRTANHGVSAARNCGIRSTSGRYIVLLDADDLLLPSYLEKAAAYLDQHSHVAFVSCGMESFGAVHEVWTPPAPTLVSTLCGQAVHAASMFRRELWAAVGGFDETLAGHEEVDFWSAALERGFVGAVLPEPLLRYRVRRGSLYHRSIQPRTHTQLMDTIYRKHQRTLDGQVEALLIAKERFIVEQEQHQADLRTRQQRLEQERREVEREIEETAAALAVLGQRPVQFGDLQRTTPISPFWGLDRGRPVDRHYIEAFLERHAAAIRGRVLEIKDPGYTIKFGGDRVETSDVLDIDPLNPAANIVADLTGRNGLPGDSYDCFILTQTLGLIYDVRSAVAEAHRLLKPGGVLLCTVPASGRIGCEEAQSLDGDFWRFTEASVRRLFAEVFPPEAFTVNSFGNVFTAAAFLFGLSSHELTAAELDHTDAFFPVVYGIHAVKSERGTWTSVVPPRQPQATEETVAGLILVYHRVSEHETVPGLSVTPDTFRAHMAHLRSEGYEVVPLRELRAGMHDPRAPARRIAITFDDGYAETARWCVPVLEELSIAATFFIVGATLDGPCEFWWETLHRIFLGTHRPPRRLSLDLPHGRLDLPTSSRDERRAAYATLVAPFYTMPHAIRASTLRTILDWSGASPGGLDVARPMTAAELLRLSGAEQVTIGAHTENHLWLPVLTSDERGREIGDTRPRLEALLGVPVTSFAYPYGAVDSVTAEQVRASGFDQAVGTEARVVLSSDDPLRLPRLDVGGSAQPAFSELLRDVWARQSTAVARGPR
jgi:peptidoglycan/xylan/chitin deacetylase (PgdA/CDA1 family)